MLHVVCASLHSFDIVTAVGQCSTIEELKEDELVALDSAALTFLHILQFLHLVALEHLMGRPLEIIKMSCAQDWAVSMAMANNI